MHKAWIGILILAGLVACSPSTPENGTSPTLAPAVVADTQAPVFSPTEPLPQITLDPTATAIPVFVDESTSPDGRYIAEFIRYGPYETEDGLFEDISLFVTPVDGNQRVSLIEETREFQWLGAIYPRIFYWPIDGNYVYYMSERGGDGCFSIRGNALIKVNLNDGTQRELLPMALREWELSKDRSQFAYIDYQETTVKIFNLDTEELNAFEVKTQFNSIFPLVWSPDNTQIAMTAIDGICVGNQPSEIVLLDIAKGTQRVIQPPASHSFIIANWPKADEIILWENELYQWSLNPITDMFTLIEPVTSP